MPAFATLALLFKTWMVVDAVQRGMGYYWYLIIVMMPFGEWFYFFMVMAPEIRFLRSRRGLLGKLFSRPPSLETLRYQYNSSPSTHNRTELAWSLVAHRLWGEAVLHFEALTLLDTNDKRSLYGLSLCYKELQEKTKARAVLEMLYHMDSAFKDYAASLDLASLYWKEGEKETALNVLESIARKSNRTFLKVELAKCLIGLEREGEARKVLEDSLRDYGHAPSFVKRQEWRYARQARKLLKQL